MSFNIKQLCNKLNIKRNLGKIQPFDDTIKYKIINVSLKICRKDDSGDIFTYKKKFTFLLNELIKNQYS